MTKQSQREAIDVMSVSRSQRHHQDRQKVMVSSSCEGKEVGTGCWISDITFKLFNSLHLSLYKAKIFLIGEHMFEACHCVLY